jgi:WD40 repeat protein
VKQLSFRVKELSIQNESLKAEVEMYRKEAALPNFSSMALGGAGTQSMDTDDDGNNSASDDFMRSGDGEYPCNAEITLHQLHDNANILCCSLSPDDVILATGGADCTLALATWGAACDETSAKKVVENAARVKCSAPVITVAFSSNNSMRCVAAGCMDGSVHVVAYELMTGKGLVVKSVAKIQRTHDKYCKKVAWNSSSSASMNPPLLATCSADGSVKLHRVSVKTDYSSEDEATGIQLNEVETLHFDGGGVEAMCFVKEELCCYVRGKPYLNCFDTTKDNLGPRKINLNHGGKPVAAGTTLEDQHVSFAVMDMAPSPQTAGSNGNKDYLALATDVSRNIILDFATGLQVRNLYGHQNDAFSNPKIAWSSNGQYLLGNTQEDASLCVWDIASTKIVQRIQEGGHLQTIRDLFASATTDTLVTTSFDKQTKVWFAPA